MSRQQLLRQTSAGLYCEQGKFHIDPWTPVAHAIVTHAHADHATKGSREYLTAQPGRAILQHRMGSTANVTGLPYGQTLNLHGVSVSLHPAGHILGSAQVRVEFEGEVWVVSGDYRVAPNETCTPFEPVRCQTFLTESTFAHPHYHWEPQSITIGQIHSWWDEARADGKACILYAYALGKSQRLVSGLDPSRGPLFVHDWVEEFSSLYRAEGISLPECRSLSSITREDWAGAMILLPPSSRWNIGFPLHGHFESAFASGWMVLPDEVAERNVSTGFALSDHADHEELLKAIAATGASRVLVTHGYIDEFVTELKSLGYDAEPHRMPHSKRPPRVPVESMPARS